MHRNFLCSLVVAGLALAAGCATVEAGAASSEPSQPVVGALPPQCGAALGLENPRKVLTYEERSNLALIDAACVSFVRESQGTPSACSPGRLNDVVVARGRAQEQARRAAEARIGGRIDQAIDASEKIRSIRDEVQRLSTERCPG